LAFIIQTVAPVLSQMVGHHAHEHTVLEAG
jgi:hypothetical protein